MARVRLVSSCISATPVHTCSILSISLFTSVRVAASTFNSSIVSMCSLRMATMDGMTSTWEESSHLSAPLSGAYTRSHFR